MMVFAFFAGVLVGSGLTVAAAAAWHERDQAAHFDRMLEQIRSLGSRP